MRRSNRSSLSPAHPRPLAGATNATTLLLQAASPGEKRAQRHGCLRVATRVLVLGQLPRVPRSRWGDYENPSLLVKKLPSPLQPPLPLPASPNRDNLTFSPKKPSTIPLPRAQVFRVPGTSRGLFAHRQPPTGRLHPKNIAMSTLKRKANSSPNGGDAKKPKANANIASFFGAAPKPVSGPPALKFDKAKWLASLSQEQKDLLKLEIETLDESWLAHLKDDITTKEFLDLKRFLERETKTGRKWFPPQEDVYSWSRHTPLHNVKVVIVGQDPYHNINQAHGLAFSVRSPTPAPPSLKNMYICLKKDYPSFEAPPNRGGLLTPWAERGVLMINTCLTVRAHEANSHSNRGWERFTQKVIDLTAQKRTRGVVYMAWGTPAGKRVQKIDRQKHLVLQSVHPSPLSASRGFFDCAHFKLANEWLVNRYGAGGEIDWALVPGNSTKPPVEETETTVVKQVKASEDSKPDDNSEVKKTEVSKVEVKEVKESKSEDDEFDDDEEEALEEALKLAEAEAEAAK
ncbi:hypothetical protein AK830_g9194 [Neonectria ditissima]|uniref:Uracil-DNA glycosylase n=1 Tax=Neonectria ditissima TaxID=78410 RepID=A0A0P7BCS8_9HYPO|nr:hypothetical protein AK830_g9194 [Neonectria ditissima]